MTGLRSVATLALAGFVAASVAIFYPALRGEFVSDDLNAIAANELVTGHGSVAAIFTTYSWWGSTRADAPGYRPLTTWSFALHHRLLGADVRSWHTANFALHGIVSWLVFLLALELGAGKSAALWSGAIFCALSIHTEAVAWIVNRAELLAASAYCAALLCALRYRRQGRAGHALAAGVLLFVGALAKESAVTLLAAPLLAAFLLAGNAGERRRDLLAGSALLAGFGVYAAIRAYAGGPFLSSGSGDLLDNPLATVGWGTRQLGALSVLGRYLALTLWPHPLSVDYSFDALRIGPGFLADGYSAVALLALAGLAFCAWRSGRRATFALLLAASSYSLVSNSVFKLGTIMAERLFYLPSVGLILFCGIALDPLLRSRRTAVATTLLLTGLCCAYAAQSMNRSYDWRSAISLFESAVRAQPRSARAHMELASAYGRAGRHDAAEAEFARAIDILPTYAAAWYNLGNARARRGDLSAAVDAYRRATDSAPRLVQAWFNLALVEQMRGNPKAALSAFGEAARIAPGDVEAQTSFGDALASARRLDEAVAAYSRAIDAAGGRAAAALLGRARAIERLRGCEAALDDYLAAADLGTPRGAATALAAACLRSLGRTEEARQVEERARSRQIANQPMGR